MGLVHSHPSKMSKVNLSSEVNLEASEVVAVHEDQARPELLREQLNVLETRIVDHRLLCWGLGFRV